MQDSLLRIGLIRSSNSKATLLASEAEGRGVHQQKIHSETSCLELHRHLLSPALPPAMRRTYSVRTNAVGRMVGGWTRRR